VNVGMTVRVKEAHHSLHLKFSVFRMQSCSSYNRTLPSAKTGAGTMQKVMSSGRLATAASIAAVCLSQKSRKKYKPRTYPRISHRHPVDTVMSANKITEGPVRPYGPRSGVFDKLCLSTVAMGTTSLFRKVACHASCCPRQNNTPCRKATP